MKLVTLTRHGGDGTAAVVAAIGPMQDADADAYAALLQELVERQAGPDLSAATTAVESASGAAAQPPADPAELLRAVLARQVDAPEPGRGI